MCIRAVQPKTPAKTVDREWAKAEDHNLRYIVDAVALGTVVSSKEIEIITQIEEGERKDFATVYDFEISKSLAGSDITDRTVKVFLELSSHNWPASEEYHFPQLEVGKSYYVLLDYMNTSEFNQIGLERIAHFYQVFPQTIFIPADLSSRQLIEVLEQARPGFLSETNRDQLTDVFYSREEYSYESMEQFLTDYFD